MDVSSLCAVTEELAAFLSEVTRGDLGTPTPGPAGDLGELYLRALEQNLSAASVLSGGRVTAESWAGPRDRAALDALGDGHGGGFEVDYRESARLMVEGFAASDRRPAAGVDPRADPGMDVAALYELQIRTTLVHTGDVARALGLPYRPPVDTALRVLQNFRFPAAAPDDRGASDTQDRGAAAWHAVLALSGRAG